MTADPEEIIKKEIMAMLEEYPKAQEVFNLTFKYGIEKYADQANRVSILRWGYNDHGIVHALITTRNAIKMAKILKNKRIKFNVETELQGTFEESLSVIILASMFHDVGNAVLREMHEMVSAFFAKDIIVEILKEANLREELIFYVLEGIICHMGNFKATSLEAKLVSIADALDMEKGRARLPYKLRGPDIHKFSALAIDKVRILEGDEKPIKVEIYMREWAGTFQIEEVMNKKVKAADFSKYIEVYAINMQNNEKIRYY